MIQLTDDLIKDAFVKTGFDEKYFPVYEEKVNRGYKELQNDFPDDEETPDNESNVTESIRQADNYIAFYVEEIEKGHSEEWAASFADNRDSYEDIHKTALVAYDSIKNKAQKEKDLDIFLKSISEDEIYIERYKLVISGRKPHEAASEYSRNYHRCLQEGKNETYAHGYANAISMDYDGDIYAESYEQAINHGMNHDQAHLFAEFLSNVCGGGTWWDTSKYLKDYHEDWQKEFYLYIVNMDYKLCKKCDMPRDELNELRHEIYK